MEKGSLWKRWLVTSWILVVFFVGRAIPLPNVAIHNSIFTGDTAMSWGASLTGGDLSRMSLFSLGLGPWMYAQIVYRIFQRDPSNQLVTAESRSKRVFLLMIGIAILQAAGLAMSLPYVTDQDNWVQIGSAVCLIVTGSVILYWLGNQNSEKGFGGMTILILSNLLLGQRHLLKDLVDLLSRGEWAYLLLITVWIIVVLYGNILFERAEYRIPLYRLSIHNDLMKESYLPVKVGVSGAMPLMYSSILLMLPEYLLLFLEGIWPSVISLGDWTDYFTMASNKGLAVYSIIVFGMALAFAQVSMDPSLQAKQLQEVGDYFHGVQPGGETKRYLSKVVRRLASFYGLFLVLATVCPAVIAAGDPAKLSVASFVSALFMISSMVFQLHLENSIARLGRQYEPLFK